MFGMTKNDHADCGGHSAPFAISVDANDLISITFTGVWTPERVDDFFAELHPVDAGIRSRNGVVHAMVHCQSVLSPPISLRLGAGILAIAKPNDRIAIVYGSILAKLQIIRVTTGIKIFRTFADTPSALAWLRRP